MTQTARDVLIAALRKRTLHDKTAALNLVEHQLAALAAAGYKIVKGPEAQSVAYAVEHEQWCASRQSGSPQLRCNCSLPAAQ